MPYIIIALVAVFLLIRYREYIIQLLCGIGALIIILLILIGELDIATLTKGIIFIVGGYAIFKYLSDYIIQKNEKELGNYLETECEQLGQMFDSDWENKLSQFKDKKMSRNYLEIAENFAIEKEKKYFTNNEDFSWMQMYIDYIDKNGRASIDQLLALPNSYLNHTHSSHNSYLIFDAIQIFNEVNRFGGYQMIDFEDVQNLPQVAKEFNCTVDEIPKPYKYNFVLRDDYVKNYRGDDVKTNIESEEISLDDLENM